MSSERGTTRKRQEFGGGDVPDTVRAMLEVKRRSVPGRADHRGPSRSRFGCEGHTFHRIDDPAGRGTRAMRESDGVALACRVVPSVLTAKL